MECMRRAPFFVFAALFACSLDESGPDQTLPEGGMCDPLTCPGMDTECGHRACVSGACGFSSAAEGTPTSTQKVGDCMRIQCDGKGAAVSVIDNTDIPDDKNSCTSDTCTAGVPMNTPVAAGTSCGTMLMCDSTGKCVGCTTPTVCPGMDTDCSKRTCVMETCGNAFADAGALTTMQAAGDCKDNVCDGKGNVVSSIDNGDVPTTSNQCLFAVCAAGTPFNPPKGVDVACAQDGGTYCNGAGSCVACNNAAECPGMDTECKTKTCTSGSCGENYTAAGTKTSMQTAGDCHANECDGSGNIASVIDNTDIPVDGNPCTNDVCTAGVPSNPPVADGTACSTMGGTHCMGGTCK